MSDPVQSPAPRRQSAAALGTLVAILLLTAAVYWPVGGYGFLDWDDDGYVRDNPQVAAGLSWGGVRWALTTAHGANWAPLSWLSHMLDCTLFGVERPGRHHQVNLALHLLNTALTYLVWRRLSGARGPSLFVAALFALHPLHVESVAWIAERKDVLSTAFWLGCLLAYVSFVRCRGALRYVATLALFAAGLLSKTMVVTLPLVLLLLDRWPLARTEPWRRLVLEKLPFFVLSAAAGAAAYAAQVSGGAVQQQLSLAGRLVMATSGYAGYLYKTIWPVGLSPLYPQFLGGGSGWRLGAAFTVLIAISLAVVVLRRRRYLTTGWLWYLVTLAPVIGFVPIGGHALADRFTYIPLTGILVMLGFGVGDMVRGHRGRIVVAGLAAVAAVVACSVLTARQVGHWRDDEALASRAVAVTRDNWVMHRKLAVAYERQGRDDEAVPHLIEVARINPRLSGAFGHLGRLYARHRRFAEAERAFRAQLGVDPALAGTWNDLGLSVLEQGRVEESIPLFGRALELEPARADAATNLGMAHIRLGEALAARSVSGRDAAAAEEAARHFARAAELTPRFWLPQASLAWLRATHPLAEVRSGPAALAAARQACALAGASPPPRALDALAAAHAELGEFPAALEAIDRARAAAARIAAPALHAALDARRALYQAGTPYRE